jgi:hypothetical protein
VNRELTIEDKINALVWVCLDGFLELDVTEKIIERYVNEQMTPVQRALWLEKKAARQKDRQIMERENDW